MENKTGKDLIEQGGHVAVPASSRTWQFWPHCYGFRVKDRRKGLWNSPLQLRKASKASHMLGCLFVEAQEAFV